ncbi:MAG TPA: hypothetical protein VFJ85_05280 [Acidimicrobiales bacterium]|nr:hypothetical protein [Acidimicrobiales bacterium]
MAAEDALDVYLNDHLAGAAAGVELAEKLAADADGTPMGRTLAGILADIRADQEVLDGLRVAFGFKQHTVKAAGSWVAEKFARMRFAAATRQGEELALLMQLEALHMGVSGKLSLWQCLQAARPVMAPLVGVTPDLDALIARAQDQLARLEAERLRVAEAAFAH